MLRRRLSGLATPEAIENPPDKRAAFNFTAAAWAVAALALALRLAYAWRLGAPLPWFSVVSSALTTFALAALGLRLAGPLAGAAAAFIWAVLPVSIVAAIFHPPITYAAGGAAFSLYLFAEGEGRGGRVSELLWAGALAGAAAALSSSALPLVAYYLLFSFYRALRKNGGARALAWLAGFVPVTAAAAALEYIRIGKLFAHLGTALAAPARFHPEAPLLLKRFVADAAAMLFWDPLGFGFAVVVAFAAGVYYLRSRRGDALFYGGLLAFALAAYNFAPTSLRGYAPGALEPTGWLLAALPAAVLWGAVVGELGRPGGSDALRRWTASLGLAAVLAILFVNGNMPFAPLGLSILALAVAATLAFAGFARRRPETAPRRLARAAAGVVILISLYPVVIIYL